MTVEGGAHGQHTGAQIWLPEHVDNNLCRALYTLVADVAARGKQSHVGALAVDALESAAARDVGPFRHGEGAGIDLDGGGQFSLNGGGVLCGDRIRV